VADPADQVSDRDAILTALRSLSPRQRACVVLHYYEDLSVVSVAAALGVGQGTVKRYLSEAMSRMAVQLSSAESGLRGRGKAMSIDEPELRSRLARTAALAGQPRFAAEDLAGRVRRIRRRRHWRAGISTAVSVAAVASAVAIPLTRLQ
jgi:transposase